MKEARVEMKKFEKNFNILAGLRIILFVGILVFITFLFYNLCNFSDIIPHAVRAENMQSILLKGPVYFFSHTSHTYPLWHIIYLLIKTLLRPFSEIIANHSLNDTYLSATLTCVLDIACLYFACEYTFKRLLPIQNRDFAFVFAWMLIFCGPYYIKQIHENYYLGQGIIVPWHNPTTLAVYPIGILCFELYFFLAAEQKKLQWKKWVIFSVLLVLSCLAKPSFYQVFIPGMALYCLVELILSKGKRFRFCIYSLMAVLPTCSMALLQLKTEVHEPEDVVLAMAGTWDNAVLMVAKIVEESCNGIELGGIGIEWLRVQKVFAPENPILSLMLLWVFPIYVIIIYVINRRRNIKMSLPLCVAISGILQYTLLYLPMRPDTGDFAWGYYISMAILFIGSISYFTEICNEKGYKAVKWIGWGLLWGHIIWGLYYAIRLTDYQFNYTLPLL